jgi:hypothetical protein
MMARFRYGNEERENRYWMEGEKRRCRMCYEEKEAIEHMWNGCGEMREREEKERGEIRKWKRSSFPSSSISVFLPARRRGGGYELKS